MVQTRWDSSQDKDVWVHKEASVLDLGIHHGPFIISGILHSEQECIGKRYFQTIKLQNEFSTMAYCSTKKHSPKMGVWFYLLSSLAAVFYALFRVQTSTKNKGNKWNVPFFLSSSLKSWLCFPCHKNYVVRDETFMAQQHDLHRSDIFRLLERRPKLDVNNAWRLSIMRRIRSQR